MTENFGVKRQRESESAQQGETSSRTVSHLNADYSAKPSSSSGGSRSSFSAQPLSGSAGKSQRADGGSRHELIARRAYELFELRGREGGHELDDWLRAERELAR